MGLKKRTKVTAEFSLASMTDMIFLLLIFFLLTAKLVKIDQFELPESESKTVAPTSVAVGISKANVFTLDGNQIPVSILEAELGKKIRKLSDKENASVTIAAEKGTSFDQVAKVLKIVGRYKVRAILATQPKYE